MTQIHTFFIVLALLFSFNQGNSQNCSSQYPAQNIVGYTFQLVFVEEDCTDPENPTSTWYYCVTSPDDRKALSHIVFQFCDYSSIGEQTILDAGHWTGTPPNADLQNATIEFVNPDPTTGAVGLKFDDEFEEEETRGVYFKLLGIYDVGINDNETVALGIKAGQLQETYPSAVEGPCLPTTGPCGPILPINLTSFTVEQKEDYVQLTWSAAADFAFDRFEVEHSVDNQAYTLLKTVRSKGTEVIYQYRFDHRNPIRGANYYRLKMVDLDGSKAYSEVHMLAFATDVPRLTVFPNPGKDRVSIVLPVKDQHFIGSVRMYNELGQLVSAWHLQGDDLSEVSLDLKDFARGIYIFKVRTTHGNATARVVLLD